MTLGAFSAIPVATLLPVPITLVATPVALSVAPFVVSPALSAVHDNSYLVDTPKLSPSIFRNGFSSCPSIDLTTDEAS